MSEGRSRLSRRLLAVLLSVIMTVSMVPLSAVQTSAATESQEDKGVTITVTDENGQPLAGASVTYRIDSASNGESYEAGTAITDADGKAGVLARDKFAENDLTLSASVAKEHYAYAEGSGDLENVEITSEDQDFAIRMESSLITDVTVTPATGLVYNGSEQTLVTVDAQEGDAVSYKVNGKSVDTPKAKNAGDYDVEVVVTREGKEPLTVKFDGQANDKIVIAQAEIKNITVECEPEDYTGDPIRLASITGYQDGDTVTIRYNRTDYAYPQDCPEETDAGTYSFDVIIHRTENGEETNNYKDYHQSFNKTIKPVAIDGITVELYSGGDGANPVYDGASHPAVTAVKRTVGNETIDLMQDEHYQIEYKVDYQKNAEAAVSEGTWSNTVPNVKDAGTYTVSVRVSIDSDNYNSPTDIELNPAAITVEKRAQKLEFANYKDTTATDTVTGAVPYENQVYDFTAVDSENLCGGTISYSLAVDGDDNSDAEVIAEINENGLLTVYYPGVITVTATLSGDDNNEEATVVCELTVNGEVSQDGQWIKFNIENGVVNYTLGTNGGVASNQKVEANPKWLGGQVRYYLDKADCNDYSGLEINDRTGEVTVANYAELAAAMAKSNGVLSVPVLAIKPASGRYGEDKAFYTLTVSFAEEPENPYTLEGTMGNNGWYTSAVVVKPVDNYRITADLAGDFEDTLTFEEQGEHSSAEAVYLVYLQYVGSENPENDGGITGPIQVPFNIDSEAPNNLTITYSDPVYPKNPDDGNTYYYQTVTVKFEASDETSGLDYLTWHYTRTDDVSSDNVETKSGVVSFNDDGTATIVLPVEDGEQYRGRLSFTATDRAGNESEMMSDSQREIVVDTDKPQSEITFSDEKGKPAKHVIEDKHYFAGNVVFTIKVTENNFDEDDFNLMVSRNGDKAERVVPTWTYPESGGNVYIGTYTLTGDGDYVVTAAYTDKSGNEMESYTSEKIVIDTVNPQISYTYNDETQAVTFTVTEHNFRPEDISVTEFEVKDRKGNTVDAYDLAEELTNAKWKQDGDTYTYTTNHFVDGIYRITLKYTDLADRSNESVGETFTVDHSDPAAPKITYSTPVKSYDEGGSMKFYQKMVTVTFTSYDLYSGVDHFTWSYSRQTGASKSNVESYTAAQLKATEAQDDASKFTASINLPLKEAAQAQAQLRGSIAASATDVKGNTSKLVDEQGNVVVVVDDKAPTCEATISDPDNTQNGVRYYGSNKKGEAEVTLKITEANFYAEDVVVNVTESKGTAVPVEPKWTHKGDEHFGTFTISGDGHYVVTATYKDRSGNEMKSYTSEEITIDTVKPVIDVVYKYNEENYIGTLADRESHQRRYFDASITAEVTITEHNFSEDGVTWHIVAKDVTGKELSTANLFSMSEWKHQGDTHTISITYPGNANYTFNVECTDLAMNKEESRQPDYFTVDTTPPTVTNVSYSTSVLDTVLSSVNYGFYNAKMTVTITATDDISGVHRFDYSYLTAAGVSQVNAQLLNQAIEEGSIKYSTDGKTATMSFTIPKLVLGNDNQFNGTVQFAATDRSGNTVERSETRRVVVDNIPPVATVTYNDPVNVVDGVSYYDGSITGTITMNEANFYADDVIVTVSRDGAAPQTLPTSWSDSSVDIHVGTFTLTDDADYVVYVSYRDKSGNQMTSYVSNQLTIDTVIEEPVFFINDQPKVGDDGGAYKDETEVAFRFEDRNYAANSITLTRMRFGTQEDVTDEFIHTEMGTMGGSGTFSIPRQVEYDGIYYLTISMTDRANHSTESYVRLIVNRFGSVYAYSDYLCSLIKDGGQYVKADGDAAITEDLIITEFNSDQIVPNSLKILITRDGEPVDAVFTDTDNSKKDWAEHVYTISRENFKEDGIYKITISSSDATGNTSTSIPENSVGADGAKILDVMTFTVDTVAPEFRNIVNLENAIASRDAIVDGKLNVRYTLIDVGGLMKVEIYLNGNLIDTVEEFENANSFTGAFDIPESNDVQTVRLVATDLAGNVTDTASADFNPGDLYVFNDSVTVSSNLFVRWYRNTPLFWGSVGGVGVLAAGGGFLLANKKKKENENEEEVAAK